MDHTDHRDPSQQHAGPKAPPPWGTALVMTALIAVFFLLREHWNHVAGFWPYLLLAACPLMHLFHGHGGHGRHGGPSDQAGRE